MLEFRLHPERRRRPVPGRFSAWQRVRASDGGPACGDVVATRPLDRGRLAVVAVDVIGSGRRRAARSAALAVHLLALLALGAPPAAAIRSADRELQRGGWIDELPPLAALFAGVADRGSGTLTYASGAVETVLVLDGDGTHRVLPSTGPVGGVFPNSPFHELDVPFSAGHVLVVATDGVTESHPRDVAAPLFGTTGAAASIASALRRGLDPALMLVEDATRYAGTRPDDAAAVVIRHDPR